MQLVELRVELVGAAISEAELRFGPREMAEIELDPQAIDT